MRKSTTISLILLEFTAITIFSTIGSLLKTIEKTVLKNITPDQKQVMTSVFNSFNSLQTFFDWLTVILGFTILVSFIFLIKAFRSPGKDSGNNSIPPLQNYLLELKSSEKNLMDSIKEHKAKSSDQDELNSNIISNIDKALVVTDTHLRIRLFNSEAEKIFNRSYSSAINNRIETVVSNYPEIENFMINTNEPKVSKEITSEGRCFRSSAITLKNTGYLFLIEDITDEKKREEITRKNRTLMSLGEMASFLAHEIRNALGVIYGYTGTMNSEPEKLEKINREIKFMTSMMENFLSFSSPVVSGGSDPVNLESILKDSSEKHSIDLIIEKTPLPAIKSDPDILTSIFSNLFLNASQANAGKIEIDHKTVGDYTEIFITDNGKGIPSEHFEKIWLPFFSTKSKGNGMGLAIVKKHLNALNSDIKVVESSNSGTRFRLSLFSGN